MTKKPKKPTATLSVAVADVMKWQPCGWDRADDGKNYTKSRVRKLFAGRERLTAMDILALEIPAKDCLWAVLREDLIDARTLRLFACDCEDQDLARRKKKGETIRLKDRAAIRVSRRYANGKATLRELDAARNAAWNTARGAAWAAAWTAAWAAAGDAAWAAAGDAAGYAARYAAWAAAWATEREWQVCHLRTMLKKEGYK